MIKRIILLAVFLIPHLSLGMDCLKSIVDRYPKTTGFVAGTVATAGLLEAYHLWCTQKSAEQNIPVSMPLITRNLIVSCRHNSRQEVQPQDPQCIKEHTDCQDFNVPLYYIHYMNSIGGTTQIFEEDRPDIRIILKKIYVSWRGIPKHEVLIHRGGLTVRLEDNCHTLSAEVNCTIILPRKPDHVPMQIAEKDSFDKEVILYRNDQ